MGSTRSLTDSQGNLANTYDYEAFGEVLGQTGTIENSYLFAGEQYDSGLDQYYLRARYYDPSSARFTQMDTFQGINSDPVTLHKYLYGNADPGNSIDPSGHITLTQIQVGITVTGTLAGAAFGSYAGYQIDGKYGAIVGGVAGGLAGGLAGYYGGLHLFELVPAASIVFQTWFAPATRFINGPRGRVLLKQLDKLQNTPTTTLYTNVSRTIDSARNLHATPIRELAEAGGRSQYTQYALRIPKGVISKLEEIGTLQINTVEQIGAGGKVLAQEYVFSPAAVAYIERFASVIK